MPEPVTRIFKGLDGAWFSSDSISVFPTTIMEDDMDTEDKGFSESAQAALGSGTNRFLRVLPDRFEKRQSIVYRYRLWQPYFRI